MLQDARFEPRLGWWPAAALVNETPVFQTQALSNKLTDLAQLVLVSAACRHRRRYAVCREGNPSRCLAFLRDLFPSPLHIFYRGLDEPRVVIKHSQLVYLGSTLAYRSLRFLNIFSILAA